MKGVRMPVEIGYFTLAVPDVERGAALCPVPGF
jgi:hypothetical protein